jgi:hypothetical protein
MNPPSCVVPLIEAVWKECRDAETRYAERGETQFGNPPKELQILQASDANWDRGWCMESYVQAWSYNGHEIHETVSDATSLRDQKPDGMYWRIGMIQFVIDEIHGRSLYSYTLGPRYARGYKADFEHIDQFSMIPDPDRILWIS